MVEEDGKTIKQGTVIGKLFSDIGPRYLDRPGGYTRIIQLSMKRLGDNGQLVLLQLIGEDEKPAPKKNKTKKGSAKKAKSPAAEEPVEQAVEAEPVELEEITEPQTAADEQAGDSDEQADKQQ